MRTTVDLPDDVFRRAKAAAAKRGQKLKDFIAESLLLSLDERQGTPRQPRVLPQLVRDRYSAAYASIDLKKLQDLDDLTIEEVWGNARPS